MKSTIMILSLLLSILTLVLTGCDDIGNENEIPKLHLIQPEEPFVKTITTKEGVEFSCSDNYYLGQEGFTGQFSYMINWENPGNMDLTISCIIGKINFKKIT